VTGIGETQLDYLTNEPLAGELLAGKMAEGTISPDDALQYGIEIGSILNRAHSRGLVHGSLSPYTVAIASTGIHILTPPPAPDERGAPYRSPEQVRGEDPDWRSDIFAFGAMLYEMAGGHRAFAGEGAELDRAILEEPPASLMQQAPACLAMEGVIAGCLEKDPTARRQRIQNAVIELKFAGRGLRRLPVRDLQTLRPPRLGSGVESGSSSRPEGPAAGAGPRPRYARPGYLVEGRPVVSFGFGLRFWAVVGAVLLVALGAIAAMLVLHRKPETPVLRFAVTAPENTSYPGNPVVSPDGRYLTFSAVGPDGQRVLWLRPLDTLKPVTIPGTEGGSAPFWSPDSQFIGFFAGKWLKKVRIDKWDVEAVCDSDSNPGGGAWNNDGTILFAPNMADGLYKVPSQGGKRELVLKPKPDKAEYSYLWPQFLPDAKHFLFFVLTSQPETTGLYVGSLESKEYTHLLATEANGVYAGLPENDARKHGYVLFIRDRNLMGQAFNASKRALQGDPVTLAEDIGSIASLALAPISVSNTSILVYQTVGPPSRQMVWMDRTGKFTAVVPEPGDWGPPRIAPNGKRAVAARKVVTAEIEQADILLIDSNGAIVNFTETPNVHEVNPVWAPDGLRVLFSVAPPNYHKGHPEGEQFNYDLFVKALDGGRAELLYKSLYAKHASDWSRDGRWVIFDQQSQGTGTDIWAYSVPEHRAAALVQTVAEEHFGALSPNGKWLAYQSDETGRSEVYVQSFDGLTSGTRKRWPISTGGGGMPRWRGDGTELFYLTGTGRMMSVPVRSSDTSFEFDPPQALFQTRPSPKIPNWFDVTSDGQHFLLNLPHEFSNASQINVMSNWTEKLKD